MIIKFQKLNDDIQIEIERNSQTLQFEYIDFLDYIYNGEIIEKIIYGDDIEEWEKDKISEILDTIIDIAKNKDKEENIDKEEN